MKDFTIPWEDIESAFAGRFEKASPALLIDGHKTVIHYSIMPDGLRVEIVQPNEKKGT